MDIIVDQFDSSSTPILHVGICPGCSRETILVRERCSLCWEKKLHITVEEGEVRSAQ